MEQLQRQLHRARLYESYLDLRREKERKWTYGLQTCALPSTTTHRRILIQTTLHVIDKNKTTYTNRNAISYSCHTHIRGYTKRTNNTDTTPAATQYLKLSDIGDSHSTDKTNTHSLFNTQHSHNNEQAYVYTVTATVHKRNLRCYITRTSDCQSIADSSTDALYIFYEAKTAARTALIYRELFVALLIIKKHTLNNQAYLIVRTWVREMLTQLVKGNSTKRL